MEMDENPHLRRWDTNKEENIYGAQMDEILIARKEKHQAQKKISLKKEQNKILKLIMIIVFLLTVYILVFHIGKFYGLFSKQRKKRSLR